MFVITNRLRAPYPVDISMPLLHDPLATHLRSISNIVLLESHKPYSTGECKVPFQYHQSHSDLTIHGLIFSVSCPFKEGHVCNEIEARILNQVRKENIRNNFAKRVDSSKIENPEYLARVRLEFLQYDQGYSFHGPHNADPVADEALKIAHGLVIEALQKKGLDPKRIDPLRLEKKIAETAKREEILLEAARRVQNARSIATQNFDLLVEGEKDVA